MKITRLRNKLLLSVATISIVMALLSMLAVSWVISRQYLDQSNALLRKASDIIQENLDERKSDILIAARQLATQKNLGSTLWYLTKYGQSSVDREMLLVTYLGLARDTRKLGRVANLSRIALYDSTGSLISFALFDSGREQVGFVRHIPAAVFQVSMLKDGEELDRNNLITMKTVAGLSAEFGGELPHHESAHYAVVDGMLAIESHIPIIGESFNPDTGKQEIKQLGLIVAVQPLDQSFVDRLSRLTDTRINVFTPQGFSSGSLAAYRNPVWNSLQKWGDNPILATIFNEIKIGSNRYYQCLIPLYTDKHLVGSIAALRSMETVQKNTWEMIGILGLIALASLLLIFPLAWYFATIIAHPLTVISRIFRGVASGKQTDMLNDAQLRQLEKEQLRDDEMGYLTQSFIAMNEAISQKIQQINEINASLENKIESRTAELELAKEIAESASHKLAEKNVQLENMNALLRQKEESLRETQVITGLGAYVLDIPSGQWESSDVMDKLLGINEAYERSIESWAALIHPDDRTTVIDYFKNEVLGQGKPFDKEYRIIRHDDQAERWLHDVGKLEFDAQGRPPKMLGAIMDITEKREREAELAANHERLHGIEKHQALSRERQRLMQDMHDGLGSSLISALRVVERGQLDEAGVAQVLKGCIDDLKLAIDSMEPVEADLLLLLATLRFRLGPRLESTGIKLRWEVESVPLLDWLDPRNALHILRILQETFTNIIKHTRATEIRVATEVENDYVMVTITDNGQGFSVERSLKNGGKGLSNQLRRTESIGAEISWNSSDAGTRMKLHLPIKIRSTITIQT